MSSVSDEVDRDPIPISALHGHGSGDLLDEIVSRLPGGGERPVGEEAIRVAILGRPNVGKSSLLNALLGRERVIVSEIPGTTRDSIDTVLRRDDSVFVLVDTAGRLHTRVNLMNELDKIRRVAARAAEGAPHEVLLVLDATVGQNGLQQAREFTSVAGVTGIVLTKLDGTAKGGVAVSIAHDLKLPIRYVGVGEGIDDLIPFSPQDYVDALFQEKW